MESLSEYRKLLVDNSFLQEFVSKRLSVLELKIHQIETIRLSLLRCQSQNSQSYACRAPICSVQRNTLRLKQTVAKRSRKKCYLNLHIAVTPRRGRIEDPFIDAGLYASPSSVRVLLKQIPLNSDANRVSVLSQVYNIFGYVPHKLPFKWEEIIINYASRQEVKQSKGSTLKKSSSKGVESFEGFDDFLKTEKVQRIISQHWGDINALQDRIITLFNYCFLVHLPLYSSDRMMNLLKVYHLPQNQYLKSYLSILRSQKVSSIPLTCNNNGLLKLKQIQFNLCNGARSNSLIHLITSIILSASGVLSCTYDEIHQLLT